MKVNFKGFKNSAVKDENGKEILSFEKSKALPTRECYSIINVQQEKIGTIERIRSNFGLVNSPKIVISLNNDKITIKKDIKELREVYEITGNDISIIGDWNGINFKISKNNQVLATIDVENQESEKNYVVDVIDQSNLEEVLSIVFALCWIK